MRNLVTKRIKKAIKEKVFPGCVVGMVGKSGERMVFPFGRFTYDSYSKRMKEDSIFDVASVTKSIPTASLALRLIENKKLGLEDKVIKYIPELENSFRNKVLVKHILTHTICYKANSSLSLHKDKKPQEILKTIYEFDYRKKPGTHYAYTNANAILLGLIIERITQKKIR